MTDISNHDVSTGGDNPAIDASALQKILPARYRILKIVGQGGAGVVYKARDTVLDKDVAIKTLHRSASPNEILRFQREAQLAGSLNHPNVMGVLDFGVTEANDPYLVLEFVKGESLAARVKRKGALPIEQALNLFIQIAAGLSHAHKRSIIHRDIKPSNVMLIKKDGEIVAQIVDFGLAKSRDEKQQLTAPGGGLGTPTCMSPEQIKGTELDQRSDIYSFGCLMYQVLTGKPPFLGRTAIDTIEMHLNESPPSLQDKSSSDFSATLESLVNRCLQKDPGDRFKTVEEISDRLNDELAEQIAKGAPQTLPDADLMPRKSLSKRDIGFAAVIFLFIVGGFYVASTIKTQRLTEVKAPDYQNLLYPERVTMSESRARRFEGLFEAESEPLEKRALATISKKSGGPSRVVIDDDDSSLESRESSPLDRHATKRDYFSNPDSEKVDFRSLFINARGIWKADARADDKHLADFAAHLNPRERLQLDVSVSNVSPEGLGVLNNVNLQSLYYHDHPVNHRVLKAISEIRALQLLELGETDVVEPQAIGLLQALPKLDTFGMHEVRINQDVLNNIAELRTLHKLDLNATIGCNGLDWTVLKKLQDLRELKLDKTELDERTLDQVAGLKTLHRLDLKCVKLSDGQVRRLIAAKNLMKMNIFASKEYISDANLALLQKSKIEILLDKDRSSFDDWKNGL